MKQCKACSKKLYKNYRKVDLLSDEAWFCDSCGIVSFKAWPGNAAASGRLMSISRSPRRTGREKTMTLHTESNPGGAVEIREIGFGGLSCIPAGLAEKAKVIRVRPMYTPRPGRKRKKKAAPEGSPAEAAQPNPEAPKPRVKRKIEGYSIYASFV